MDDTNTKQGYSAAVEMWLDCGNHGSVPLSQAAPTFVIAARPVSVPACAARLILVVDGRRFEHAVQLVDGMTEAQREATISLDDSILPF